MTAIASGYIANRIAGLLLTLLFLTFSWIQIFLLHQHSKKLTEAKYFIHYSVNLCVLTIFLNFIDPYGVFGLLTYFFGILVLDAIGTKFLLSSAIFIIYGHFKAHYRILKQDTPKFFLQYLFAIFIITFIGNLIWTIVLEVTQQRIYSQLINITTVFCLIGIWIIDLYGYWLVRKLMIELQQHASAGPTDAATDAPTSSAFQRNLFDYEEFLSRMRRFHFLLSIFFLLFVSLTLYGLAGSGNIRKGLDPSKFNFWDGLIFYPYLYLLICCLLTWWIWIPIKIKDCTLHLDSNHGESQKTTKAPSTHTDLSKQNQQAQEEELVHLNSNDQPSPVLIGDDQPSPVLVGDSDTSTRPVRDVARSLSQDENSLIGASGGDGNRENSVSVSEIESPKKDNPGRVTMAGITEEGGIVVV